MKIRLLYKFLIVFSAVGIAAVTMVDRREARGRDLLEHGHRLRQAGRNHRGQHQQRPRGQCPGRLRVTPEELKRHLDGISNIMLTRALQGLEKHNLVIRVERRQIPPHVEYSLTESCKRLLPALEIISPMRPTALSTAV
mgnify:CR=1 FL=1